MVKIRFPRPPRRIYKEEAEVLTVMSLTLLGILLFVIVMGAFL